MKIKSLKKNKKPKNVSLFFEITVLLVLFGFLIDFWKTVKIIILIAMAILNFEMFVGIYNQKKFLLQS